MRLLTLSIAVPMMLLAFLRASIALRFLWQTRNIRQDASVLPSPPPCVGVFMPIRGVDPSLREAIRCLLAQDYENFRVTVIVDSPADDAWSIVSETLSGLDASRVKVLPLTRRSPTCSLVCNGLLQFLDQLDDDVELVTFCASDMVVSRNWMREMVLALSDPTVGCTLGNRWYMSPHSSWGWMVRYLWCAMSNVFLWQDRFPWGGTACLRQVALSGGT